jgi:hypothetical protein
LKYWLLLAVEAEVMHLLVVVAQVDILNTKHIQ